MSTLTLNILYFIFIPNTNCKGIDPCTQYSLIQYQDRRAATRSLNFGKEIAISDDFLSSGWYRVERSICAKMPTSAPKPLHCGTWYPIWLNGNMFIDLTCLILNV